MANPLAQDLDHVLEHTRGLWEDVRGERIFITGGTGFFGSWLLESFVWANDRLRLNATAIVLTRDAEAFRRKAPHLSGHPAVRFLVGDVRSFPFPDGAFGHVVHAATEAGAGVMAQDPLTVFDVNVLGTRHTLEFARQCGAKAVLFTSSGAVYGRQPPEMTRISEGYCGALDPTDAHSTYGAAGEAKRAAETLCALYARQHALSTKVARCFSFVGPYLPLDGKFAIGNFIRDGLQGGPIRVLGDGSPYRSYLYAADLAIWLWTILARGEVCRPYNVGSSEPVTIAEVAGSVARAFSPPPRVEIARAVNAGQPAERYVPDTARAESTLGLGAWVSLPVAIRRTVAWCGSMVAG